LEYHCRRYRSCSLRSRRPSRLTPVLACRLLRACSLRWLGVHLLQRDVGSWTADCADNDAGNLRKSSAPRWIVEIVFIDLADGEQGVEPVSAAGILLAQEVVLFDGARRILLSSKRRPISTSARPSPPRSGPPSTTLGNRSRRSVRIDYALIFAASALARGRPLRASRMRSLWRIADEPTHRCAERAPRRTPSAAERTTTLRQGERRGRSIRVVEAWSSLTEHLNLLNSLSS